MLSKTVEEISITIRSSHAIKCPTVSGPRSSVLLGACLFHWNEENISEGDLRICIDDLVQLERIKTALEAAGGGKAAADDYRGGNAEDEPKINDYAQSHLVR